MHLCSITRAYHAWKLRLCHLSDFSAGMSTIGFLFSNFLRSEKRLKRNRKKNISKDDIVDLWLPTACLAGGKARWFLAQPGRRQGHCKDSLAQWRWLPRVAAAPGRESTARPTLHDWEAMAWAQSGWCVSRQKSTQDRIQQWTMASCIQGPSSHVHLLSHEARA